MLNGAIIFTELHSFETLRIIRCVFTLSHDGKQVRPKRLYNPKLIHYVENVGYLQAAAHKKIRRRPQRTGERQGPISDGGDHAGQKDISARGTELHLQDARVPARQ